MGRIVEIKRPDRQSLSGYLAESGGAPPPLRVVVLSEAWGMNDQIRLVADALARAGYAALVPDLYRGAVASTQDEARRLMGALDFGEATHEDVRGALRFFGPGNTAVLGFGMGAALALMAAVHLREACGAVCFYGVVPQRAADVRDIKIPLCAHFAARDEWCSPRAVDALEARLREGKARYELHRYDVAHAFMNERLPEAYDASARRLAWERTLGFLAQLASGPSSSAQRG